jgi:GTP-binding protein
MSSISFIDHTKIKVRAGDGGDGIVSFMSAKGKPKLGADGGDGGFGGDVFLVGTSRLNTLGTLRFRLTYNAENGTRGGVNNRRGADGDSLEIPVPLGTQIFDESGQLLGETVTEGQRILVAKGGKRGIGNARFLSSTRQAPQQAKKGEPGEERELVLELKVLADVGLAGLPNAGKSTLLSKLSAAKPKIADYPFTTLVPNLGVVERLQGNYEIDSFVIADIPGLIEGAAEGKGLGHEFLKHLERTKVVLYLISAFSETEEETSYGTFQLLQSELRKYRDEFINRPSLIVLNKIDLVDAETLEKVTAEFAANGYETLAISALAGTGLDKLRDKLFKMQAETVPTIATEEISEPSGKWMAKDVYEQVTYTH